MHSYFLQIGYKGVSYKELKTKKWKLAINQIKNKKQS